MSPLKWGRKGSRVAITTAPLCESGGKLSSIAVVPHFGALSNLDAGVADGRACEASAVLTGGQVPRGGERGRGQEAAPLSNPVAADVHIRTSPLAGVKG